MIMTDTQSPIRYSDSKEIHRDAIISLYKSNDWSSARKPDRLIPAIQNSHSVMTAWFDDQLIGLANSISDGHLVVYYPHVLVHPSYHRQGVGQQIMSRLMQRYEGFHQHAVLADKDTVEFYERCGFERSVCPSMWIYAGDDH